MSINLGIKINEKFFDDFPIDTITCWEHIELWATIKNIPINNEFIYFIISGGKIFKIIYDIILDTIKNTNYLDAYINNVDFFELFSNIYNYPHSVGIDSAVNKWILYSIHYRDSIFYTKGHRTDSNYIKIKYEIFTVLGNKFPIILNEFCNKNIKLLYSTDKEFLKWAQTNFNINIEYGEDDYISDTYGFYIKE